jgi:hypothetical protein
MSMMHVSFLPNKMKSSNAEQHGQYSEVYATTGSPVLLQYSHQNHAIICRSSKLLGFNTPGIHIILYFQFFSTVVIIIFAHYHPKSM